MTEAQNFLRSFAPLFACISPEGYGVRIGKNGTKGWRSKMSELKRTQLYDVHVAAGATMVDFGGWDMPVQYPTGIVA